MFTEEKPALLPLPVEPFRYCLYGERTVNLDGCVEVEAASYGAPPGWIGRRVHVQWNATRVRNIIATGFFTSASPNSAYNIAAPRAPTGFGKK